MAAHETHVKRHDEAGGARWYGVGCTCGWAVTYPKTRREADEAASAHKRAYWELVGQEIEDMEGDRSTITEWNPETGRYTTDRGWTYWPGEFTVTEEVG